MRVRVRKNRMGFRRANRTLLLRQLPNPANRRHLLLAQRHRVLQRDCRSKAAAAWRLALWCPSTATGLATSTTTAGCSSFERDWNASRDLRLKIGFSDHSLQFQSLNCSIMLLEFVVGSTVETRSGTRERKSHAENRLGNRLGLCVNAFYNVCHLESLHR